MNLTDYTYLINKPDAVTERHFNSLEKVVEEFPYFQSARILKLKHLYNQDSFKYNYALKIAAAYTTDRSVLFDFITSDNFITVQNVLYEKKVAELLDIPVIDSQVIIHTPPVAVQNKLEQSILSSIQQANQEENSAKEKLNIGKPLAFSSQEKHSFQEWLQLSRFQPIQREELAEPSTEIRKKKLEIIDKFIESNPKIPPINKEISSSVLVPEIEDKSYLMTETLAKVYLEQKKYSKAIQAYQILILKYPEKSSYFANLIQNIKNLQQNNI